MTGFAANRPFRTGANDRREFIFQDSEVSLIAVNDLDGNPIFLGRAKTGTDESSPKWQIRQIAYDSAQGVSRVTWPQNDESAYSSNYEFVWSTTEALTITNITKANPGVVTVSNLGTLQNGDKIIIQDVSGMSEVNFDGASKIYTVANIDSGAKTFELSGVNTTGYTTYTLGGEVDYGEFVNYTYG